MAVFRFVSELWSPTPRRAAMTLLLGLLLLIGGFSGCWDSFHRPRPVALDISHDSELPTATAYKARWVRVWGTVAKRPGGLYLHRNKEDSWHTPDPWFKDAPNRMNLVSPINIPDGATGSFEGLLTVMPSGSGTGASTMSLRSDRMNYVSSSGGYATPAFFSFREHLDSILIAVFVLVILLIPLWFRYAVQVFLSSRSRPNQHLCPCFGYDCRGSLQRCPECGPRVESPNFRLELGAK